jgi:flagellar hook-associated protein 1 FlgK
VLQAQAARDSVSGVNLDEEASNLLRYQQAYQASGKVMQVASELFDVLLSLGN